MKKKINITLRKEIIIYITILLISALLLISVVLLKLTESLLINQKVDTSLIIISALHSNAASLLTDTDIKKKETRDNTPAQKLINSFTHKKIFKTLVVADKTGKIFASNKNEEKRKFITNKKFKALLRKREPSVEMDGEKISVTYPLYLKGRLIGGMQAELAVDDIKAGLSKIWALVITFIIGDAIVFIAFGTYLLSKTIIRPIKELMEATEKVAQGNFTKSITAKTDNEIGRLARSFNAMTISLKEKLTLLKSKNMELEKAKNEIIQSEKLASVGRLAAGIAHEIGNPLGSLQSYVDILCKEEGISDNNKDILKRMERDGKRIDRVIRELLFLASPSRGIVHKVNINDIIKESIEIISSQKGFNTIRINLSLYDEIPVISIDTQKMQQIIINLLINSSDAMPAGGGEITIFSEVVQYKPEERQYHSRRISDPPGTDFLHIRTTEPLITQEPFIPGDRVIKVSFADTGTGIAQENIPKIFDPFFTTKDPGKGTGLGLSICHRIIKDMKGKITAESVVGKGTTITILLPA